MAIDTTKKKLVSIGLPTYQGEARIARALESLCAQTYSEIEIIVSDNGSSDRTMEIAEAHASRDPRIQVFRQKENTGRINNFLFVLARARGDYFMWAGDDDEWEPQFVEILMQGLDTHPNHGVALSSFHHPVPVIEPLKIVSFAGAKSVTSLSYTEVFKKTVMHDGPMDIFISGLWRHEIVKKLFSREAPDTLAWDRIIMAEAALMTHFYSAPDVLFHKYKNPASIKSRYGKDPEQQRHFVLFAYDRYLYALLARIMSSPFIPIQRKLYAPLPWLGIIWKRRKRIVGVTLRDLKRVHRQWA